MSTEAKKKITFSIRSLLYATTLIAVVVATFSSLDAPYKWLFILPASLALMIWIVNPWTLIGGLLGFLALAVLGELWLIGWAKSDNRYLPSLIVVGTHGSALGSAVQALACRLWILGAIALILAVVVFIFVLGGVPR